MALPKTLTIDSVERQNNPFGFSNASIGGHSARSMMFLELRILVHAMPTTAIKKNDFTETIVEENVLEKPTLSSRKKSLRHLIELYGMDPSETLFRVLWELGHADLDSLPQLCLVCAYARDSQLRHSFELVRSCPVLLDFEPPLPDISLECTVSC